MKRLVLGGARSGKSAWAEAQAAATGCPVTYLATAEARDEGMRQRIAQHRQRRPGHWACVEEPVALAAQLQARAEDGGVILVDCLTLWLTNLLCCPDPLRLEQEREALLQVLPELPGEIILVSTEVGLGVVPMGELSRRFVDEAGLLHQRLACLCEQVVFVAAGLPLAMKGSLE
ncbi:bifunctional adenosylcobinamide kinase/adenosylcobinamide-phosphate guanylyltransferase [Frateuria aurantia]